jgi:short-subunit dehydrogenase
MEVERVCQELADEHADATLLVNAAGIFSPKPFLEHDGPFYDSYLELDRAIFFLTQTVVRGMVGGAGADRSSTSAVCGPTRPSRRPRRRRTRSPRPGCTR